jgi:queuine/archaeosine tRNA-ribosyltransferase
MKQCKIIHESAGLSRVTEIVISGRKLPTPSYFPSISSYGVKFSMRDMLYLLKFHKYPRLLLSAYDLHNSEPREKTKLMSIINGYREKGFLFMDSGLYESSWRKDPNWDMNSYKSLLSQIQFDLYTSFDVLPEIKKKETEEEFKDKTFKNMLESSVFQNDNLFIAIVHGSSPDTLVSLVGELVKGHPNLCGAVAIAERDCGYNILERAGTISEIRRTLNQNSKENVLHILGCGNPLSMLLFSYCGADTFDSLDWMKYVINPDPNSLLINDFSHLPLLNCKCRICDTPKQKSADYLEKVLLHNLVFYQGFIVQIQSLIKHDNLENYLRVHFGDNIINQVNES